MEDEPQLNAFGEALARIMSAHGVDSPEELAMIMNENGYEVSAEELRLWMHGDPAFLRAIEEGW
jgi:hypothetical protein